LILGSIIGSCVSFGIALPATVALVLKIAGVTSVVTSTFAKAVVNEDAIADPQQFIKKQVDKSKPFLKRNINQNKKQ